MGCAKVIASWEGMTGIGIPLKERKTLLSGFWKNTGWGSSFATHLTTLQIITRWDRRPGPGRMVKEGDSKRYALVPFHPGDTNALPRIAFPVVFYGIDMGQIFNRVPGKRPGIKD